MVSDESFLVLVHYRWSIKKIRSGVKFTNKDPHSIFMRPTTSFNDFLNSIIQKFGLQCGTPASMNDVLPDDDDADDVELDIIVDDSGDDIAESNPVGTNGGSSFEQRHESCTTSK
ncbi:hypothetical protein Ahy_A09g042465 [Arachis hypogaea]|uniref:Uncharacterized protein n=1 Tax=Arachis hypogaea TaxID=3818 RepID=A0A445BG41_ARAHY|nr:hypothetical protein Ahy_A09g042465 [Arachis hypogaea]